VENLLNVTNDFDVCNETAEIAVGKNICVQRASDFKVCANRMCLIDTCRRARHYVITYKPIFYIFQNKLME